MISDYQIEKVIQVIEICFSLRELSEFAEKRHGYGDSDGGFGATYETDLDEYSRIHEGDIPKGHVEIYGYWGSTPPPGWPIGYEFQITEQEYLLVLIEVLSKHKLARQVEDIENLIRKLSSLDGNL